MRKSLTIALNIVSGAALLIASAWFVNNMLTAHDIELSPEQHQSD